jgi:hypothetical protein
MRLLAPAALAFLALPAQAQDGPQGIGFAQAEEGTWLCRHEDAAEALSCAREHCLEQAPGQECLATAWCFPANWSALMTVWIGDFHATHALCGAPNEVALTRALAALCANDGEATRCEVTLIVDPDGNERAVEGVGFDGGAAVVPPEPPPEGDAAPPLDLVPPPAGLQ